MNQFPNKLFSVQIHSIAICSSFFDPVKMVDGVPRRIAMLINTLVTQKMNQSPNKLFSIQII